jgi:hypothetical protein
MPQYWVHSDPNAPAARPAARRCARGEHCTRAQPDPDGATVPAWATDGPFCARDYRQVARALAALPARYVHLWTLLGEKGSRRGDKIKMSRTPPVPVNLQVDALLRDFVATVVSWEERLRVAAGEDVDTDLARRRRDERALAAAVAYLESRLDGLLGLPAEPMVRFLPVHAAVSLEPGTLGLVRPHAGYVEVLLPLDGAGAGREILHLAYRARSVAGETTPPPVRLIGVPCARVECQCLGLEEVPGDIYKSECTVCGHLMTHTEYRAHTIRWAKWAQEQRAVPRLEAS